MRTMAELVLRLRDRELARVGIIKTSMTVGRDATSDLVIDNAAVSRTHATVSYNDGTYRVRDQDSENGIMLNGRRVRKASLDYGDVIGIGKFEIELVDSWHEPVSRGEVPAKDASKNVMKTMQVDAASAARMRDEAVARLAAQKGLPVPPPKTSRAPASGMPSRAPASSPTPPAAASGGTSGGPSTLKLVALVVAALIAGVVLTLMFVK
jgi:pSer/pThr/pTyr-binding forkhead associated (FHA) protein